MENKQGRPKKIREIKKKVNTKLTPAQLKIAEREFEFYEQLDKLLNEYDKVVQQVHKGLSKEKAYYKLCRILFDIKAIYDI